MKVSDIMTADVTCVGPDTSIREAARYMRDLDVGSLPVCDNDQLAGMITDRDIAIRAVAEGLDTADTKVSQAMSEGIECCYEDHDLQEAERIMQESQVRRLPVLNRDKRLVGIVALGDLAVLTEGSAEAGATLESISQPA